MSGAASALLSCSHPLTRPGEVAFDDTGQEEAHLKDSACHKAFQSIIPKERCIHSIFVTLFLASAVAASAFPYLHVFLQCFS